MADKTINDEERQRLLLIQVKTQLLLLLKLVLGILLFVAPFLSLFVLGHYFDKLQPDILISWRGIFIPIITVVFYMLIKRYYGRLFGK